MKQLILVLALLLSSFSFAQTKIISVDAFDYSYTGGFGFGHKNGKRDDEDKTEFKFNLNYAQNFGDYVGLMWKAKAYFNRTSTEFGDADSLTSAFGAAGGFLYNFESEKVKDSIFVGALLGVERAAFENNNLKDEAGFNLFVDLEAGKRWDLGQYAMANISFAPTVALNWKRYGGDIRDEYYKSGYDFRINFLKFDILF